MTKNLVLKALFLTALSVIGLLTGFGALAGYFYILTRLMEKYNSIYPAILGIAVPILLALFICSFSAIYDDLKTKELIK